MPDITLSINSDWATLQLVTADSTIAKKSGIVYPNDIIFTGAGVLIGQPNEGLQPQEKTIILDLQTNSGSVTFFTGFGSHGIGGGPGSVSIDLANVEYLNGTQTGDGLNIKVFRNAPVYVTK